MAKTIQPPALRSKRGRKANAKLTEPDFNDPNWKPVALPEHTVPGGSTLESLKQQLLNAQDSRKQPASHVTGLGIGVATSDRLALPSTNPTFNDPNWKPAGVSEHKLPDGSSQESLIQSPQNLRIQPASRVTGLGIGIAAPDRLALPSTMMLSAQESSMALPFQTQPWHQQHITDQLDPLPVAGIPAEAQVDESTPLRGFLQRDGSDRSIASIGSSIFATLNDSFSTFKDDSPPEETADSLRSIIERNDNSTGSMPSSQPPGYAPESSLGAQQSFLQQHSLDMEGRLDDLIRRNQQQQMNLYLQQQQLEQQRLELRMQGQHGLDTIPRSAGPSFNQPPGVFLSPMSGAPGPSSLLREDEQPLRLQYQMQSRRQGLPLQIPFQSQQQQQQQQQEENNEIPSSPSGRHPFNFNPHSF